VWKIGPECVAQQAKKVEASTMNCGERSARPTVMPGSPAAESVTAGPPVARAASMGGRRTNSAAGTSNAQARIAMQSWEVRQSYLVINQPANGEMIIGAAPMPADTSETARLRCLSNQPVTVAMVGANTAPAAPPTMMP
jgi:hypothetical protein